MPNTEALQVFYGTLPLVVAIFAALWKTDKHLNQLEASINKRIDDMTTMNNRIFRDEPVRASSGR